MMQAAKNLPENNDAIAVIGEKVLVELRSVFDPEIPVNIYDLGLIYKIDIQPLENGKSDIHIHMTLTTPNCPVAGSMPGMVEQAVSRVEEIENVHVALVWDPPWDRSRMSDEAKLQLNMF